MWTESSSVNAVNLVKNLLQFRDIEYFLKDYIFWRALYMIRVWATPASQTDRRTDDIP